LQKCIRKEGSGEPLFMRDVLITSRYESTRWNGAQQRYDVPYSREPKSIHFLTDLFNNLFLNDKELKEEELKAAKSSALHAQDLKSCKVRLQEVVAKSEKESLGLIISFIKDYTASLKSIKYSSTFSEALKYSISASHIMRDLKEILLMNKPLSQLKYSEYNIHEWSTNIIKSLISIIVEAQIPNERLGELRKALLEFLKGILKLNDAKKDGLDLIHLVQTVPEIAYVLTQTYPCNNINREMDHYIMTTNLKQMLKISRIFDEKSYK